MLITWQRAGWIDSYQNLQPYSVQSGYGCMMRILLHLHLVSSLGNQKQRLCFDTLAPQPEVQHMCLHENLHRPLVSIGGVCICSFQYVSCMLGVAKVANVIHNFQQENSCGVCQSKTL